MYLGGYFSFSKKITSHDIEYLSSWRKGKTVSASWTIEGYAILSIDIAQNGLRNQVLQLDAYSKDPILIGLDTFVSDIIEPIGLEDKFVTEFFVTTPISLQTSTKPLPKIIEIVLPPLRLLQDYLKNALKIFRDANSISDYRSSMGLIRTSLDTLLALEKNIPNFYMELGKELFVNPNVIIDVPGVASGKEDAAKDIVENIWRKFQSLSNINSKTLHTTTIGARSSFEMKPEKPDAEFVLISCLVATNYLLKRIEII